MRGRRTRRRRDAGEHAWLGLSVVNADLERPLLKVRVNMDYCEVNCEDPSNWRTDNTR